MHIEPICINDSQFYSLKKFPDIARNLNEYPDICLLYEKTFCFKFTGVVVINDIPVVVFPKNYKLPKESYEMISEARILVRVLLKYRNEPKHEQKENVYLFGDQFNNNARITTALKIMEDYKAYGDIHRNVEINATTKKGKIDWSSTVNKSIPIISHNQIIYSRPIIRHKTIDYENIVVKIHKYVVSECVRMWGWLLGIKETNIIMSIKKPCELEEAIFLLKRELKNVYVQREINVIKMLISYLTVLKGTNYEKNKEILGTKYFSFIWEAVCGYLFNNKYPSLCSLVPQPEWESDIAQAKISQRPDIFVVEKKCLYILDAKYYNYKCNLPGWHDVVKQMFYRQTVMLNIAKQKGIKLLPKETKVKNVFLFPGDEEELFKYIGRVFINEIDELGEVKAFLVNQKIAMEVYAYRNKENYKEKILEELICKV